MLHAIAMGLFRSTKSRASLRVFTCTGVRFRSPKLVVLSVSERGVESADAEPATCCVLTTVGESRASCFVGLLSGVAVGVVKFSRGLHKD